MDHGRSEEVERRSSRHRRHRRRAVELEEAPLRALARGIVTGLFLVLLLLSPLPMGANRDWAWSPIVVAIGGIAALCGAFGGSRGGFEVSPEERGPLRWLLGAYAIFLLVALLQMSSWAPASGSAPFYARAREILGHAHAAVPSLAIDASFYTLLKCLACGLFFLVARTLCRQERGARLLLMTLLASAIIVAAYAIYMQVTTHNCYVGGFLKKQGEYKPLFDRCLMSGTFVSPNNFACYLGMAVVAALALLFDGSPARHHYRHDEDMDEEDESGQWLSGTNLALAAVALFCMGGVLISGSRGGFGATIGGLLALGYLLIHGRENFGASFRRMIAVGVLVVLGVVVIAGGSLLSKAVTSSNNFNRVLIWKASLAAVRQSPLLGWGLGSYPDVYAINQPKEIILPNDKAHSTPIEVLVEMGIPGGIAAMLVVLIPWWTAFRATLRRRRQRYLTAAAFAVVSVPILHSMIDFSLQIPAIAFMSSAFLGLGWAHAFSRDQHGHLAFTGDS